MVTTWMMRNPVWWGWCISNFQPQISAFLQVFDSIILLLLLCHQQRRRRRYQILLSQIGEDWIVVILMIIWAYNVLLRSLILHWISLKVKVNKKQTKPRKKEYWGEARIKRSTWLHEVLGAIQFVIFWRVLSVFQNFAVHNGVRCWHHA